MYISRRNQNHSPTILRNTVLSKVHDLPSHTVVLIRKTTDDRDEEFSIRLMQQTESFLHRDNPRSHHLDEIIQSESNGLLILIILRLDKFLRVCPSTSLFILSISASNFGRSANRCLASLINTGSLRVRVVTSASLISTPFKRIVVRPDQATTPLLNQLSSGVFQVFATFSKIKGLKPASSPIQSKRKCWTPVAGKEASQSQLDPVAISSRSPPASHTQTGSDHRGAGISRSRHWSRQND